MAALRSHLIPQGQQTYPLGRTGNFGEATVDLIIRAAQNGSPNKEHIVVRPARILQHLHEGNEAFKGRHHRHQ